MSSKTECTQDTVGPEYIHCTFGVNCLKATTDKEKQANWNKTNEINISLTSNTIFLRKKRTPQTMYNHY